MKKLLLGLVSLFVVAGQALAADKAPECKGNYNDKYEVVYSKINDVTTFKAKKFNQDDDRLNLHDDKDKMILDPSINRFSLSMNASFPGTILGPVTKGAQFKLTFAHYEIGGQRGMEGQDKENVYTPHKDSATLVLLVDGKKSSPKIDYTTRVDNDAFAGIFHWEFLTATFTQKEIEALANSTDAEGEIAGVPFTIDFNQRCFLKDILARAKGEIAQKK